MNAGPFGLQMSSGAYYTILMKSSKKIYSLAVKTVGSVVIGILTPIIKKTERLVSAIKSLMTAA